MGKDRKNQDMVVYKSDDMIQKSRMALSLNEQKCIAYMIGKIRPTDTISQTYEFEIKDFMNLCNVETSSYTTVKRMIQKLADKSWWLVDKEGGKTEKLVRWFSSVEMTPQTGTVRIEFHKDMMPFIFQVVERNQFWTSYNIQSICGMRSSYSTRLYEILKSYEKNNNTWFFNLEELKAKLNAEHYKTWKDFNRRVLEPAITEINTCSDLSVKYTTESTGRKITKIIFKFSHHEP